ncbi:MAG: DUF481 domain-containing protein [Rheinheimera sp.]|nr:DUF481 domain-containing protein [Rheinheimera sp.]
MKQFLSLIVLTTSVFLSQAQATTNDSAYESNVQAVPLGQSALPQEKLRSGQTYQQLKENAFSTDSALGGDKVQAIDPDKVWGGDIELGLVLSSGNTQSTAIRTNAELMHELTDFRNKYLIQTLIQRNSQFDEATGDKTRYTTAQRVNLVAQSNYKFYQSEHSIFGRASYLNDRFGAFEEQGALAAGYAMRAYQSGDDYLDLETGPGIAYQQTSDKKTSSGMIWWVAANLDYHLTASNSFRQALEWSVSLDGKNSSWQSRSSLTSQVNGRLSMRLNFTVKYDSNPGQFRQKTDTETSATLVYSF